MFDPVTLPRSREFVERKAERPLGFLADELRIAAAMAERPWRQAQGNAFAAKVMAQADAMHAKSDDALQADLARITEILRRGHKKGRYQGSKKPLIEAFALVREVTRRTLGLEAYKTQLTAAYGLFCGCAVEMATGEGKTLSALTAAAMHGLCGRVVHVISANDYLAERDGLSSQPVFEALGLTTGIITPDMERDDRRIAYRADIVYAANKEVAFDFLKDRLAMEGPSRMGGSDIMIKANRVIGGKAKQQPVLRALDVAIVDEVDSVLIDDAGTPLLISTERGSSNILLAAKALEIAGQLVEHRDWRLHRLAGAIHLTEKGLEHIRELSADLGGLWRQKVRREELVSQALSAMHLFRRDEHYIVRDGKVMIVDQNTGRRMEDRFWGQGLQQMIELKEGVEGSGEKHPLISTTYQRFFRRYRLLSGTSGTIDECARELSGVYRLTPVRVPLRTPSKRKMAPLGVYSGAEAAQEALVEAAIERTRRGQAVLIGTRTIQDSDAISAALTARSIDHQLLSAAQDADENALVAKAGQPGMVTVATNMAGRGTDIALAPSVVAAGGLVVLLYQRHFSRRVDRQLIGRCARQEDPGEAMVFVSPDDALFASLSGLSGFAARHGLRLPLLARGLLARAQSLQERENAIRRARLVEADRRMAELLAFSGGLE